MTSTPAAIYTIGHSTRPIADFLAMLHAFGIATLVDIRTVPKSRHNPQFGQEALTEALEADGVSYRYMKALGGLRKPWPDSPNAGWRNESFRGYADHMQTPDFEAALADLIALSQNTRLAIMCAEAVPWRCHRSLVADALSVRGVPVEHIMGVGKSSPHKLTRFAHVEGARITYPPEQAALL